MNICIIPARGGSKRIPKKNIIDFHGKPLIAYTIEAAINSGLFKDNIYISSDSRDILKVTDGYKGVKAIKRPKNISGDRAVLQDAVIHLLNNINAKNSDYLCMLQPNCPLRFGDDIRESYKIIKKGNANCLVSVVDYCWLKPFWAVQEKNGKLDFFFGRKYLVDSKKLPQNIYCPSGAVIWVKISNFLIEKKFYGKNLVKYEIPFERGVDIDTYKDLELARKLYKII